MNALNLQTCPNVCIISCVFYSVIRIQACFRSHRTRRLLCIPQQAAGIRSITVFHKKEGRTKHIGCIILDVQVQFNVTGVDIRLENSWLGGRLPLFIFRFN